MLAGYYIRAIVIRDNGLRWPALKLALITSFTYLYLVVVHLADPKSPYIFYSEVNYMGLVIPIALPLFFDLVPRIFTNRRSALVFFAILMVIMINRSWVIYRTSEKFSDRIVYIQQKMKHTAHKKIILRKSEIPESTYIQSWSMPHESLLISSIEGREHSKTVIIEENIEYINRYLGRNDLFLEAYKPLPLDTLNNRYFDIGKAFYNYLY